MSSNYVFNNSQKPAVRWKRILLYDPIQCARYFYCELGAQPRNTEVLHGFVYMLTLIIMLALLVGVLYSLHVLVQDYQALTAASKLLRFLFKRDLSSQSYTKPAVRWKRILLYDPIQCARYFYCELGAQPRNTEVLHGFVYMLTLIIMLALLVGVLYSLHVLVQDYQALTAASKLLRFLFKRDLSSQSYTKPAVRWKRILLYDPIQCARYFYCELGAQPRNTEVLHGFVYMLTLIIMLALLVGVLYSLHVLVQDYQALTAASKLLRFLFKRDLSSQSYTKPAVRWKRILLYDPIQCARYFYCELGAQPRNTEVLHGLDPTEQDTVAHAIFKEAYEHGLMHLDKCREKYALCPFNSSLLFELIRYLLRHP